MFTTQFPAFVSDGDKITCEVDGFTCVAWTERDDNTEAPDKRQDGFWPSLDSKDNGYIGPKSARTLARHMAAAKRVMDAWKNDEWDYCGVCVAICRNGVKLTEAYDHALWSVERNYPSKNGNAYLVEVANELLGEALTDARSVLAKRCNCAANA